jgi:hypothetical protein
MVGYACIAGVVFVLWSAVGFFVPGIDYPLGRLRSRFLRSSPGQHHLSVHVWGESKQIEGDRTRQGSGAK